MTTSSAHPPSDAVRRVREWSDRRTFAGADFRATELLRAKRDHTVSVVLPARDEAATVGRIVTSLRRALVEAVPLIDEIVVIDSHSSDATAEVAAAAGARVHAQSDLLPELGDVPGKGEAQWKSLAATTGDLIAFIDADLQEFDPAFATGLLGPLLTEPGVAFVKGCYERPLREGGTMLPTGGGRVTELAARPLIAAHWPELGGFVQPLAGEYAGTREVLESIPFAAGYGLELGMLIDLYERVGLDALAQVDLGRKVHRNSPDSALSLMALQMHHAVFDRLEHYGRLRTSHPLGSSLTLHHRAPAGGYDHENHEVVTGGRPPMRAVARTRVTTR